MAQIQSCGFLIYRVDPELSFLLMKHPTRWDLPKGHVDEGESELQCALRELEEETGILAKQIEIDSEFRFEQQYMVSLPKFNHQPRLKTLTIFLARLLEPSTTIRVTEHESHQWMKWNPPHEIQTNTINPVLASVAEYWQKT